MKVTYSWLKDFVDIKIAPKTLADKLTMAGLEVTSLEQRGGDFIFEIEITSNRPDWLSVIGIAREVAAITGKKLKEHKQAARVKDIPSIGDFSINIDDKKDCPLYTAKIIREVKVAESPEWLKSRLELVGCRSVNNIVDITNYVLFELGEPLHAFDLDKLSSAAICVRRAEKNEKITTIDGQEKILNPSILVIGDKEKALAIAGVMGGRDTEVTAATKNILLEAASFNPVVVRKARQELGLQSESAYRFERGINSGIVGIASQRAAGLIEEIAGGRCVLARASKFSKTKTSCINLETQKAGKILGVDIQPAKIKKILTVLGFKVRQKSKNIFAVDAALHRQDVNSEVDLIEEIARISGYEFIPTTLPKAAPRLIPCAKGEFVSSVKSMLIGLGLNEAITYSLIDRDLLKNFEKEEGFNEIEILNPLSIEQGILRPTLLPGLISSVACNLNQKQEYINIFEIANVFKGNGLRPIEELVLGVCLCGTKTMLLEQGVIKEEVSLLYIKGILEALFERAGIKDYNFNAKGDSFDIVTGGNEKIGMMARVNKGALDRAGIKNKEVFYLELSLDKVFSLAQLKKKFVPSPRYPGIARDISFVLKESVSVKEVMAAMQERGRPLLRDIKITDYYKGKQIASGSRGLTVSCSYRSDERTLTEPEISPMHASICKALTESFGAIIR